VLCIAAYLTVGGDVLLEAVRNILHGEVFDENFLMTLATIGAIAVGQYPEAVAVMLFYQTGELFQDIAVEKSRASISSLMDIRPDYANIEENGQLKQVAPDSVATGTVIVIKPGEKVPLDGVVVEGASSLNTTALTGESLPRDVRTGDGVISGCVNMSGLLRVRTTGTFGESTVSKILELVENSDNGKANTEKFITRFAKIYTPAVVTGAALLAFIPSVITGQWTVWIQRALIFLVISCPCALVISIPLGFFGGIGGASRIGVLVKGSNYLEALARAEIVVFDKTGTLTKGNFKVTAIHPEVISAEELLEVAALAESYSDHPISQSLRAAYKRAVDKSRIKDVEDITGHGIKATVDGRTVYAGNSKLMDRIGTAWKPCDHEGTIIHVAEDGQYVGHIVISRTRSSRRRKKRSQH
jgi:Cd2+/Zn2+-exporting ATPase